MDDALYDRAVQVYRRHYDEFADQPSRSRSGFNDPKRPDVLVLENARGALARVRYDEASDTLFWLEPKE